MTTSTKDIKTLKDAVKVLSKFEFSLDGDVVKRFPDCEDFDKAMAVLEKIATSKKAMAVIKEVLA